MALNRSALFLCILLALPFLASAQSLDSFSENRNEFIGQMKEFMTASKRTALEEIFETFEKQFNAGIYTDEEFAIIQHTSNLMLTQKMKASPYFSLYLECLGAIKAQENSVLYFSEFHEVLDQMLADIENRNLKPYQDFLKFSIDFFPNKHLRYSKAGVTWLALADEFNMEYENKAPVIKYVKLDLVAARKNDSIRIKETSGIYFPTINTWEGVGGKVSWERNGMKDVYCEIDSYRVDTKKAIYEVPKATLYYPEFFPKGPIRGSMLDKIVVANKTNEGSYPRFESDEGILKIKNIGEGITYTGGFRLHGTTVYGYGSKEQPAQIDIVNQSQIPVFKGISELFVIRKGEKLSAESTEAAIYFDQDSIYHPSVNIKFDIPNRQLSMYRGKRGSDRNPFFNSSLQMNINSDNLDWYLDKDSLIVGKQLASISRSREVEFESLQYFSEGDFRRLQNLASTNPIAIIKVVSEREGSRFLDANMVAEKLNPRYDISIIQPLLYDLVARGFINYDKDEETIEVKDKIYHYADASQEKVDFDYLQIISKSDSINAVVSLKDKRVDANGISSIEFSRTQRVALKPTRGHVTMKTNRDMEFDGRVYAGFGLFEGKDYNFQYDPNQIVMDSVRFFDLFVPSEDTDKNGEPIALSVSSRIEHVSGTLLIDAPNNKSGKEDIPSFPSFNSNGPAYVYYDKEETKGGVYKRDSFYFELDEFSFNSLDSFSAADLNFEGNMVSAEIFPPFKEELVLREEDQSYGFVHTTPEGGYPTYQSKGNYTGELDLSNAGFLGKGQIDYLQASFQSEDIVFQPEQLTATADRFDLEEDKVGPPEIPEAVGYDVSIDWRPYRDSMYLTTKEKPFELFKDNLHTLTGKLILTPDGLKADGTFKWDKGKLRSKLMSFGAYSLDADTSTLQIFAFGSDDLAFDTRNVKSSLDFEKQEGRIKANSDELSTTMPYNQYQTSMNEFIWNMKDENITFLSPEGKYGSFRSIHPDQDSLIFDGKTAFYDLHTNELRIGGVPYIQTCDALVYTDSGNVEIQKGGIMTTLTNAKIIADTSSRYHVINRATVDILGKKEYKASGFYEYNIGDKKQEIEFADIIGTRIGKGKRSEKKTVTRATGEVDDNDHFYIDHKTEFRGKISLSAESKNLQFDGFAKIDASNLPDPNWFTVKFEGDKNDLAIVYDEPKNYKGDPLQTGLYLSKATAKAYPSIMQPLNMRKDRVLLEAKGLFKYNKARDLFIFGDSLKIVDNVVRGNLLTFNNSKKEVVVEGKLDIGSGLNYMNVDASGVAKTVYADSTSGNLEMDSYEVLADVMAGIELIIPDKLLKIMYNDIKSSSFDAKVVDYAKDKEYYERAVAEFVPDNKAYNKVKEGLLRGELNLPAKINKYALFFSNLPMKWNTDYQSFVLAGNKAGLASIGGEAVNRWLTAYIEFKMPTNEDDRVYIYLKSPSEYYYFLGFKQGILNLVSNNTRFNEEVMAMKKKDKLIKMDDGEFYEIQEVDPISAQQFVNRIKAAQ